MTATPIRVLCVDDHRIVREGIALIIAQQPDMEVVGTAASGTEAVDVFRRNTPDVTLMDLQLPGMSGTEAIREIRLIRPDAKVIVLTMYQGDEDIFRALKAGASTYLLKDSLSDDLIKVIRDVHGGLHPVSQEIQARLAQRSAAQTLTSRETEVIHLVFQGLRNKEIADVLAISEETAQVHVKNIFAKLKVKDRTAAVNVALHRGIIHVE
jgi:DNA-binding NarL/FixJ family response regulator